ncbi:MAG: NUDIX domain-containing protein [Caldilineaceae bacterium]
MMKTKKYSAAGGVVIHQNQVLLLDRPSRNEVRLPKGHIDPGETAEITARRETTEEAGYSDLEIVADLGSQIVEFDYKGRHYVRTEYYFLMRLASEAQEPRNAKDAADFIVLWTPIAEAVAKLTFPAEQQTVQKAIDKFTESVDRNGTR